MGEMLKLNIKLLLGIMIVGVLVIMSVASFPPNPIQSPYGDMDYAVIDGKPYILFNNSFVNFNLTLAMQQGGDYVILPNAPYFHLEDNKTFKYGLNVSILLPQSVRLKYIVNSNHTIHSWAYDSYYIPKDENSSLCYSNPFSPCDSRDPKLYFEEICEVIINNESEIIHDPECEGNLTNDNMTLELYFTLPAGLLAWDPTISFSLSDVESMEMDAISNFEYLIIWCDETLDDTFMAAYMTNGTLIVQKTLDSNNGGCTTGTDYMVDIILLDAEKSLFAATWISTFGIGPTRVGKTVVANYSTSGGIGGIQTFASVNVDAVTTARLNDSRYTNSWIDSSSDDINTKLFNEKAVNLSGDFKLDNIGRDAKAIASTGYTNDEKNYTVFWFDDLADTVEFITLQPNSSFGFDTFPIIIVDTLQTSENGALSVDSFDGNISVFGWRDVFGIANGIRFAVYKKNGTLITSETTVRSGGGASKSVAVSTMNDTVFGESWHDVSDSNTNFEIWMYNGTRLVTKVAAFPTVGAEGAQEILSTNPTQGICDDNLIIAGVSTLLPAGQTRTFFTNGSIWASGECDPCTYTFGNWNPPCDCNISLNVTMDAGSNLTINGSGLFHVFDNAVITGFNGIAKTFGVAVDDRCTIRLDGGGSIR